MPTRVLNLDDIQVTSRHSKQSLLLTSSITLEIPTSIDEQKHLSDIADMTRSGQLWIAKAATSRLEVFASVEGAQHAGSDGPSTLPQHMVETAGACLLWDDLNLKLRKETPELGDEAQPDAYTSFVINHPDLSSDFLSPKDIPCAKLLALSCDICYGPRPRRNPNKKPTKRRKIDVPERSQVQTKFGLRRGPRPSYAESDNDGYNEDDKQRREEGEARLLKTEDSGIGPASQDASRPEHTKNSAIGPEELRRDLELLLRAALIKMLGLKMTTSGVRVVGDLTGPSLIDIAPAVFNIRYLQAFASRAEHIPCIASCLSSLDAESPSLRAKIRSLGGGNTERDGAAELEKRLHMLVQRGLDVLPLVPSKRRAGARAATEQQDSASQQPEPVLEQDGLDLPSQDALGEESQTQVEDAEEQPSSYSRHNLPHTDHERQQQFGRDQVHPPDSWHSFQQDGNGEWLDLSQARYILDENGQRLAFEDLDHEEHSYQLVPLGSDDLPV